MNEARRNRELRRKERIAPKIVIPAPEKDNMGWVTPIAVMFYFVCVVYILEDFPRIVMSFYSFVKMYCLFVGLSFLIPIRFYRKWLTISIYEYIIINIIALAPVFCEGVFFINETFKTETYKESYNIVDSKRGTHSAIYILENQQYENQEYMRKISQNELVEVHGSDSLTLYISDGFLGIRIIEKKVLH